MSSIDREILGVVAAHPRAPTYYIKNVLRRDYRSIKTDAVRRRLVTMESDGKVLRAGMSSNSIQWTITDKGRAEVASRCRAQGGNTNPESHETGEESIAARTHKEPTP